MDATIIPASSARNGRAALFPWAVGAVCLGVFLALHVGNHLASIHGLAQHRSGVLPAGSLTRYGAGLAATMGAVYVAFALAGGAIAAKTRDKILWMVPALILVCSPLPARMLLGEGVFLRPLVEYVQPWGWPSWLSALVDLVLVLLPGALVAARVPPALARVDGHHRLATVLVASFGLTVYLLRRYGEAGVVDVDVAAHLSLALLFVIGVALGVRTPWFPAVHLIVAVLASEAVQVFAAPVFFDDASVGLSDLVSGMIPALVAIGLGAISDPLAMYLRTRRERLGLDPAGDLA